jgi:branched-chain amino acid transport system substrate-binding protein
MRVSRSTFVRQAVPGLALATLFCLAGCKTPDASTSSATGGAATSGNAAAAAQDTSGDTIKVGHYASLTGPQSTFGTQSDDGVKFAQDELNGKGGVLGKKFAVDTEDDQSKPEEAATVVTRFASDPQVVAVIGEVASSRSLRAAPILQRAQIPMISPSSTNPNVTKVGNFIFRVCFIDPFQGYVMAQFAHDHLHAAKVAILRDQGQDYSVGLANVFADEFKKMGGTITTDVSYQSTDSDFRSELAQIKATDPDAIFIPGYYGEVGTIARQAREQGINVPLLGGDGWDSDQLIAGAGGPGKALEGCFFSTHYSKDDKSPRVQNFVKAYAASHGGTQPASLVAQGYDAMMLLADAIKRANSTDRDKVRQALADTKGFPGVTGDITIDANRNATKSAVVLQIKGNDFVYVTTVKPRASDAAAPAQ